MINQSIARQADAAPEESGHPVIALTLHDHGCDDNQPIDMVRIGCSTHVTDLNEKRTLPHVAARCRTSQHVAARPRRTSRCVHSCICLLRFHQVCCHGVLLFPSRIGFIIERLGRNAEDILECSKQSPICSITDSCMLSGKSTTFTDQHCTLAIMSGLLRHLRGGL